MNRQTTVTVATMAVMILAVAGLGIMAEDADAADPYKFTIDYGKYSIEYSVTEKASDVANGSAYILKVTVDEGVENLEIVLPPTATRDDGNYAGFTYNITGIGTEWSSSVPFSAGDGADRIMSVTMPDSYTWLTSAAFKGCTNLESVTLSKALTSIEANTFEGTKISSLVIPEGVVSIGNMAFNGCSNLTTISIPSSVTTIQSEAFRYTGLQEVEIEAADPGVERTIGREAFTSNANLTTINIPDGFTKISDKAFKGCTSLSSVTVPGTVEEMWSNVFDGCSSLEEVSFEGSTVLKSSGVFNNCKALETVEFHDGMSGETMSLISGCTALKEVEIPEGFTEISQSMFNGCTSLTNVVIPAGVTSVVKGAFDGCSSLETVTFLGDKPPSIDSDTFEGGVEFIVPEGAEGAYQDVLDGASGGTASVNDYVAKVGETGFYSVQSAVDSIGASGTVTLVSDITLTSEGDVVKIPAGKNITLDMGGMTVTAAEGFSGRYIVNYGELIITGEGTFDGEDVKACRGLVTNNGVLTIENGKFYGNTLDTFAFIWNDATATFNGGSYTGAVTMVGTAAESHTYINGGYYESPWYPAIDNRGYMEITGGTFVNTSCSSCDFKNWGYTVRSGVDSPSAHLLIDESQEGSVSVTGVQGALSIVDGSAEIRGGEYETIACEKHPSGSTSFYALYVAPENGNKVEVTVTGGIFETVYRSAARIGLDEETSTVAAVADIRGGSFISPSNVDAVSENAAGGGKVSIAGGSFSSDVSEYAAYGYAVVPNADGSFGLVQADTSDIKIEYDNQVVEHVAEGTTVVIPASDGEFDNVTLDISFETSDVTVIGTVEGDVTVGYRVIESSADMSFDLYISGVSDANMKVTITVPLAVESGYSVVEDSLYVYSEAGGEIKEEHAYLSGNSAVIVTNHNTPFYISYDVTYVMPPIWDDDDDYVPPIVPVQPEDSGDDNTTTIVACAAAAVVAALIAAYLIIDRRQ